MGVNLDNGVLATALKSLKHGDRNAVITPQYNRHGTAINYRGNCSSDCVAIGCVILAVAKIAQITDILRTAWQQRCGKIKVHMLEIGCIRRRCCTDGIGSRSAIRTDRGIRCGAGHAQDGGPGAYLVRCCT